MATNNAFPVCSALYGAPVHNGACMEHSVWSPSYGMVCMEPPCRQIPVRTFPFHPDGGGNEQQPVMLVRIELGTSAILM